MSSQASTFTELKCLLLCKKKNSPSKTDNNDQNTFFYIDLHTHQVSKLVYLLIPEPFDREVQKRSNFNGAWSIILTGCRKKKQKDKPTC